jgi:hypothetical protein
MLEPAATIDNPARSATPLEAQSVVRIPVLALGMSLGLFIVVTYLLCVLFDLWFPAQAMNPVWTPLLPGFTWLTWPSFFLGLAEAFAYGCYVALVFGPLYNFFAAKFG